MLDIATLMLVLAVTTMMSVLGLLVAALINREVIAIRYWAGGLSLFIVGLLLQVTSEPAQLWISATIITQAYFVLWWGTRVYRQPQSLKAFMLTMLAIQLVQGGLFLFFTDSLRFSIMTHSLLVVVVCLITSRELWQMRELQRPLVWMWSGLWAIHALVYLRRFLLYGYDQAYMFVTDFQQATAVESLNYLEGIAFLYGFSLLCVVLTTQQLQSALKRQATRDPLTDLFNRRAFEEAAVRLMQLSERNGQAVSLLMLDLDHFKDINDQHGHAVGDRVLLDFAHHLERYSRRPDLLCRFGGEEFLLLLPNTELHQAIGIAERIRKEWQRQPLQTGLQQLSVTVSIGVAETLSEATNSLYVLIERADQALYAAKQQGRNKSLASEQRPSSESPLYSVGQ